MDSAPNPRIAQYIAEAPHLEIWCYWPDCERHVTLTAAEARAAFGLAWDDIPKLNRTLRCTCGARARDKKVQARFSTLDHAIETYRARCAREIREFGEPQTAPMKLPGIGEVRPEDLGLTWTPQPPPLWPDSSGA